jgi:hypothetical protein
MPNVKFIPKNIDQVREVLIDFPADLEIEIEIGVDAKTVEDLRLLSTWPHGLGLICNREGFLMQVRIERARPWPGLPARKRGALRRILPSCRSMPERRRGLVGARTYRAWGFRDNAVEFMSITELSGRRVT